MASEIIVKSDTNGSRTRFENRQTFASYASHLSDTLVDRLINLAEWLAVFIWKKTMRFPRAAL